MSNVSFNCHGCKAHLSREVEGTNIKLHLAMDDILEAFGEHHLRCLDSDFVRCHLRFECRTVFHAAGLHVLHLPDWPKEQKSFLTTFTKRIDFNELHVVIDYRASVWGVSRHRGKFRLLTDLAPRIG